MTGPVQAMRLLQVPHVGPGSCRHVGPECECVWCRRDDWASASPLARAGRSEHKTRRVNLLEEGAYETAPTANGRRIRKPLDNDFLYYSQASNIGRYLLYMLLHLVVLSAGPVTMIALETGLLESIKERTRIHFQCNLML